MHPKQITLSVCPCCESKNVKQRIYERRFRVVPFQADILHNYSACGLCGFFFVENPLDQTSLSYYYERAFILRRSETDEIEDHVLREQWEFASKGLKNIKNLLEVGPDGGQFLDHVAHRGKLSSFYVESSVEACKVIEKSGLHRPYEEGCPKMDIVVMRHVLEHIPEPFDYLCYWNARMNNGAGLFIEVPDWTYLDGYTDGLMFEHVNHFTVAALTLLAQRAGFAVDQVEYKITPGYHTTTNRVLRLRARKQMEKESLDRVSELRKRVRKTSDGFYEQVKKVLAESRKKSVAFYAASSMSSDLLLNSGIDPKEVLCVFDKDSRKQKNDFHGVPVVDPTEVLKLKPEKIVLNTSYDREVEEYLRGIGYSGEVVKAFDLIRLAEGENHVA